MEHTKELMEKAKNAETAEKLLELAKAEGVKLTTDEAEKYFAELHRSGELADEELDNVSGGCGKVNRSETGESSKRENVVPLYHVGQRVEYCESEYSTITGTILVAEVVKYHYREIYYPSYDIELKNGVIMKNVAQENIQIP